MFIKISCDLLSIVSKSNLTQFSFEQVFNFGIFGVQLSAENEPPGACLGLVKTYDLEHGVEDT